MLRELRRNHGIPWFLYSSILLNIQEQEPFGPPKTLASVGTRTKSISSNGLINCAMDYWQASHFRLMRSSTHFQAQAHGKTYPQIPPSSVYFLGPLLIPISVSYRSIFVEHLSFKDTLFNTHIVAPYFS